jgi:DNA repair photolyase
MDLTPVTFEEQIFAKGNVSELLRRELHQVKPSESIAIGTVTDPYQPAEKRYRRTRAILNVLADWEGLDFSITTKSNLVTRDLELLQRLAVRHRVGVNITVTTVDRRLARALEPKAPRPDLRLKTVSELAAAGVPVGVFAMPVLPGAGWFIAAPVFLMPSSMTVFFPFLEQEFPELVERYQRDFERSAYMSKTYAAGLRDLVRKLRTKHRLVTPDDRRRHPAEISGPQLSLF